MKKKGLLIVFEGLDGCGKSTQAGLFAAACVRAGRKARLVHFPAYESATGRLIAAHLRGDRKAPPKAMAVLYALNKYEYASLIYKLLKNGIIVVVDRYTASNAAYQSARAKGKQKQEALEKWVFLLEKLLPRPDAVVLIDVPAETACRNNLSKRARKYLAGKKDSYEGDLAFQRKVRARYLKLAESTGMIVIKSTGPSGTMLEKSAVQRKILEKLAERGIRFADK